MKKLFVLSFAMILAFGVSAQKIGVKVGYGMSAYTLNFDSPEGAKMGMGFNAGLLGEYGINDMISVRLDVNYNTLGSDLESSEEVLGVTTEISEKTNVNYLQIGLSPKFSFGPVYAFVGPYFGYALKSETKSSVKIAPLPAVSVTVDNFQAAEDAGIADFDNKMDFGANLGFGVNFSSFFVEANVGYGFSNIYNKDSDYYKALSTSVDDLTAAIAAGVYPGTIGDYYPFMDGTTAVKEPVQKNLFFGLSFGYLFGFGK